MSKEISLWLIDGDGLVDVLHCEYCFIEFMDGSMMDVEGDIHLDTSQSMVDINNKSEDTRTYIPLNNVKRVTLGKCRKS